MRVCESTEGAGNAGSAGSAGGCLIKDLEERKNRGCGEGIVEREDKYEVMLILKDREIDHTDEMGCYKKHGLSVRE